MTRRRLLALLLAAYPAWWRRLYGDDAAAILAQTPPNLRTAVDLLTGAIDAWLRQRPPHEPFFARFGDDAHQVLALAEQEARALHHSYLGTEHILLGLLAAPNNPAGRTLTTLGISATQVRARLIELVGSGSPASPTTTAGDPDCAAGPTGPMRLTPRTKQGFAWSCRAADRLGDPTVGADHLLLGLLDTEAGVGLRIVTELVSVPRVREELASQWRQR